MNDIYECIVFLCGFLVLCGMRNECSVFLILCVWCGVKTLGSKQMKKGLAST